MALNLNRRLKTYYSIREVAEMFDLNESTLRYWETEFPFLKPKTSGTAKIRQLIHNLVKVRGFKIAAAREMLTKNRQGVQKTADALQNLIALREDLQVLKSHLDAL